MAPHHNPALSEEELPDMVVIVHQSYAGPASFRVDVHPERDVMRVAAIGELDIATVAQLQAQIRELREAGFTDVVLDLRQLTFIDSSGVELILDEDRFARRTGQNFSLISGTPAIQRVLTLCAANDTPHCLQPAQIRRSNLREDKPLLPLGMRRYLGALRHEAARQRYVIS
jgi:anti-sigma B factor antagonist